MKGGVLVDAPLKASSGLAAYLLAAVLLWPSSQGEESKLTALADLAVLPHLHATHSHVLQVQKSPLQSGHLQPSHAHGLESLAEVFLAAQHECLI
jgi:hypothetical protein